MIEPQHWAGDKPYFLAIEHDDQLTLIDLDESGWLKTHADLMRVVGVWHLVRKGDSAIAFSMRVEEGEQPYYVARHVGNALLGAGTSSEVIAYGIGKKRLDGAVDRVWVLPSNQVVVGDDVEWFAIRLLRQQLADP